MPTTASTHTKEILSAPLRWWWCTPVSSSTSSAWSGSVVSFITAWTTFTMLRKVRGTSQVCQHTGRIVFDGRESVETVGDHVYSSGAYLGREEEAGAAYDAMFELLFAEAQQAAGFVLLTNHKRDRTTASVPSKCIELLAQDDCCRCCGLREQADG
jgi:hypothetical protein